MLEEAGKVKNKKKNKHGTWIFPLLPVHQPLQQLEVKNLQNTHGELFAAYFFNLWSPTVMMKVAVTFAIFHAPAHSIFFPGATYMVQ